MPPPIDTVTGVFAATAEDAVAVTVTDVEPASSLTLDGLTDSVIETAALSSSAMVPVAASPAVTLWVVPETLRPTVKVSSSSTSVSSVVETVNVCVSPAVPLKLSAFVLAV